MIVCTNGKEVVSTYQDTEWNDNGQYRDHPGVSHAFKCNPALVNGCLGTEVLPSWTHEQVAAVAVAEVPFGVEYQ